MKLWAKSERIVATAEGNGPVNALDRALRVALERIYPQLGEVRAGRTTRSASWRAGTVPTPPPEC